MKSIGERIGVLAMACKCIKHEKALRNILFCFFWHFFCFSGIPSWEILSCTRLLFVFKKVKGTRSNKGGTAINYAHNQVGLQAAAWQPVERVL